MKTDNLIKYGLLKYKTNNIGDEIQSIAAKRFLPEVDIFIDRDEISSFKLDKTEKNSVIKLIMNGWYSMKPESWPFECKQIKPLLISMHINQKNPKVVEAFKSKKSLEFMKKNGPVGARDISTMNFLLENGIDSYFSGCLTLTLNRNLDTPRQEYVLAVDLPKNVVEAMKKNTNRKIIEISVYNDLAISTDEKFLLAEYFLFLYQSAHCIVTTRLHSAMPSLAFETPVLLIEDPGTFDKDRYSGLSELLRCASPKEYINNPALFDLNNPPKNKNNYIKYRNELIERAKKFTGYDNYPKSFATHGVLEIATSQDFISIFSSLIENSYEKLIFNGEIQYLKDYIDKQYKIINDQKNEIDSITSVKLVKFIVYLKNKINKTKNYVKLFLKK